MIRLRPIQEIRAAAPSPEAVRAWLDNPITELFFNRVYRNDPASSDFAFCAGFTACRSVVLDLLLDFETRGTKVEPLPPLSADYGAEELMQQRARSLAPEKPLS